MHAHGIALTNGGDLYFLSGGALQDLLQGYCGSGRLVLLMHVVAFDDIPAIVVLQNRCNCLHGLEEEIHPYGKIGAVKKRGFALAYQLAHFVQMLIPAGSADYHWNLSFSAADDIWNYRLRRGEIDCHLSPLQQIKGQTAAILVFAASHGADHVPAFPGHFGHQGAGFSVSKNKQPHAKTSGSTSEKNT